MRILFAGAFRSVEGGAEAYQRELLPALVTSGHDVALLHEFPATSNRPDLLGGIARVDSWCVRDLGREGAVRRADAWRPDVTYVHGLTAPALEAQLLERFHAVLYAHSYYGTCATGTKLHAFPRAHHCRRTLGPACLVLHYPRRCGGLHPAVAWNDYRRQRTRRALLERYRGIGVASRHMQDEYLRHGVPASRLHLLPYPPTGSPRSSRPPPRASPPSKLVFLGRLTEVKGVDLLLRAIPLVERDLRRSVTLDVLGAGPERARLEALAGRLGVRATFHGWVDGARRTHVLGAAHALVVPSVWPEPWGLTGIEAANLGVPSVAFASGGIVDWLVAGESGELAAADPPTVGGLAAAIGRLLKNDDHHAALARGAWKRAAAFSMSTHVQQLIAVLEGASR